MKYKELRQLESREAFLLSLPALKNVAIVGEVDTLEVTEFLRHTEPKNLYLIGEWKDRRDEYRQLKEMLGQDERVHFFVVNEIHMSRAFTGGELDIVKVASSLHYETIAYRLESYWRTLRHDGILCGNDFENVAATKKAVSDFLGVRGFETINHQTLDDHSFWSIFRR